MKGKNRLWRKNRNVKPQGRTDAAKCSFPTGDMMYGVDLNRNFGYKWNGGKDLVQVLFRRWRQVFRSNFLDSSQRRHGRQLRGELPRAKVLVGA